MTTSRTTAVLPIFSALLTWGAAVISGCGGSTHAAGPADRPTAFSGQAAVDTVDLMAWDTTSRATLKRLIGEGVAVVRYVKTTNGVELELLSDCIGSAKYRFDPYSANESKVAKSSSELSAALPLGSAALSGKVGQGRSLRTDFMLAGSHDIKARDTIRRSALHGQGCERATHVISTVFVGGFAMAIGQSSEISGGVSLFGVGASGSTSSSTETLANEGDAAKCAEAQKKGVKEKLCSVPLRIALLALEDGPKTTGGSSAPATTATTSAASTAPLTCPAGMVKLDGGKFTLGSGDEREEGPPHEENVAAFCIDTTEVTAAAYAACVEAGKCNVPTTQRKDCNYKKPGQEKHPINCVSAPEAEAYCKAQGKRLPSEIEWEFAARGREGRKFPWGQEPDLSRACANRMKEGLCDVGSLSTGATREGVLDLAGNVGEWTSSLFSPTGYGGTTQDYNNVVRGGTFKSHKIEELRGAARRGKSNKPDSGDVDTGMRCAK